MLTYKQTLSTIVKQKLVLYWMSLRIHLHIDFDALDFTIINFSSIPKYSMRNANRYPRDTG